MPVRTVVVCRSARECWLFVQFGTRPSEPRRAFGGGALAEGVGFEPTIRFPVYTLSKRAPSATRPSLRRTPFWRGTASFSSRSSHADAVREPDDGAVHVRHPHLGPAAGR